MEQSPSSNILVESVYCNWSGGCAMGSLGADTNISDITYRNIYTWSSNQMYMIKSNGGSGTVQNVLLENFIGMKLYLISIRIIKILIHNDRTQQRILP